jgi:hypothetical protein
VIWGFGFRYYDIMLPDATNVDHDVEGFFLRPFLVDFAHPLR